MSIGFFEGRTKGWAPPLLREIHVLQQLRGYSTIVDLLEVIPLK